MEGLYIGDNLSLLRELSTGSVHLIATDPPFNKGQEFKAPSGSQAAGSRFQDQWSWKENVDPQWLTYIEQQAPRLSQAIAVSEAACGEAMGAYACWLGIRLLEMHRVLREDGSFYLHIDSKANAYVRLLLDTIFGADHFKSEIVWKRTSAHSDGKQGRHQPGAIHDTILFYSRGSQWTWNPVYTPYDEKYVEAFYKHREPETGRRYRLGDITAPGQRGPAYEVMGVTRHWRYSQARMEALIAEGRIIQQRPGVVPAYKRYLDEMPGVPLQDLWTDILPMGAQARERTGYPTQKPLALYQRIIELSSNPGDLVLDPFCGSGTTLLAAESLGRRWLGADIAPEVFQLVEERRSER